MELQLLPVNQGVEQQLKAELQKNKMFGNVEQFITMFNEGILSSGNEIVDKYAEMIEQTYKNLSLLKKGSKSRFIIKSMAEVSAENSIFMLEGWKVLCTLKRMANIMFEEDFPENSKIIFHKSLQGVPQTLIEGVDGQEDKIDLHWTSEKMFSKNEHLNHNFIIKSMIQPYILDEDSYTIDIAQLIDLKDDFVIEIEKILQKQTFLDQDKQAEHKE